MLRLIGFIVVIFFLAVAIAGAANACPSVCLRNNNTTCDMGCASRMTALERHSQDMRQRSYEARRELYAPTAQERMVIREMPGTTFQHAQPRYRYRNRYDR